MILATPRGRRAGSSSAFYLTCPQVSAPRGGDAEKQLDDILFPFAEKLGSERGLTAQRDDMTEIGIPPSNEDLSPRKPTWPANRRHVINAGFI